MKDHHFDAANAQDRVPFPALGQRNAVIVGLWIEVVGFLVLGFISDGTVALVFTVLSALGSIARTPQTSFRLVAGASRQAAAATPGGS